MVLARTVNKSVPLACGLDHNSQFERATGLQLPLPACHHGRYCRWEAALKGSVVTTHAEPVVDPALGLRCWPYPPLIESVPLACGAGHSSHLERATGLWFRS